GQILLIPRGSIIAGLPAGRTTDVEEFTGGIIMDDIDKIDETRFSRLIREKLHSWYSAEVLSRLENKNAPIINIQHRCCQDDMSGYLQKVYNFKTFAFPLLDNNGEVQFLKSKYDVEELKKDIFRWNALYQQQPIADGGNIIKKEWFSLIHTIPTRFDYLYITSDTAFSTKTSADDSVFMLCGIADYNLYLLNCIYGKWGLPELKTRLSEFYLNIKQKYNNFSTIYIENKASGQSLLQEFKSVGLPVEGILPTVKGKLDTKEYTADKYTRLMEVISDISNGYVYIPINTPQWCINFIEECVSFTGDGSTHDDFVDCLIYALKIRRRLLFNKPVDWGNINKSLFRNVF
ncbi:MAG: phage terminase large subunit, partial [Clostridia bacterium]|nr:phage terminase large subunit [Clostridia bacterium]